MFFPLKSSLWTCVFHSTPIALEIFSVLPHPRLYLCGQSPSCMLLYEDNMCVFISVENVISPFLSHYFFKNSTSVQENKLLCSYILAGCPKFLFLSLFLSSDINTQLSLLVPPKHKFNCTRSIQLVPWKHTNDLIKHSKQSLSRRTWKSIFTLKWNFHSWSIKAGCAREWYSYPRYSSFRNGERAHRLRVHTVLAAVPCSEHSTDNTWLTTACNSISVSLFCMDTSTSRHRVMHEDMHIRVCAHTPTVFKIKINLRKLKI